ncbi:MULTISPECIES: efflux RND transporter periplasmic adaptor subunit [Halomonadaceae]|uniref:Efflux RND transporter periplasmic adaptor subunit n=1 Tax=Vreelandella halophila TaxID=86177 RepID=A0A9X4Y9U2_9GAMM|nr:MULTISPECIES: efflux RND transporter periplasmic adaptor subunit [Halomonas]MYL25178.1 efflux RND transporter periplasmic adaptor subunit [Halomonas utahensis]MYL75240.1 efflux RND transporter periplasmic adaptor subunit [Halomonas sp. 22501_18_FS]
MKQWSRATLQEHRSALTAALILLGVILWMLSGTLRDSTSQIEPSVSDKADNRMSVRVLESTNQTIRDQIIISGRTLADRSVAVKAETDGVVQRLHFERGDRVNEGDMLVELAMEDREARLLEARSLVEQREIEYRGAQALRQKDSIAENELARAKAALESARAQLRMALEEARRTRLKAPIEGVVETRDVEVGDFLNRGAPVTTLVDLNPIRVKGSLSERYLNRIEPGSPASVTLINGSEHEGEVAFVGRVASPKTRTFPVEVVIDNPEGDIIEGLTAEVTLSAGTVVAHRLPSSILTLADDGTLGVKGVSDNSEVVFYPVEVVRDTPEGVWLTGLPETVQLIVVGQEFVSAGQKVETVPYEGLAAPGASG